MKRYNFEENKHFADYFLASAKVLGVALMVNHIEIANSQVAIILWASMNRMEFNDLQNSSLFSEL